MRGTLSLREPDSGFLNWINGHTFVRVKIGGKEEYQLRYIRDFFGKTTKYVLANNKGNTVQEWLFKSTLKEVSLIISESPPLSYTYSYNFKPISVNFSTPSETVPAALKPAFSTRSLELDGMEFKHKDFESVIHFRCPEEKLYSAIIVANLLFSPLIFNND